MRGEDQDNHTIIKVHFETPQVRKALLSSIAEAKAEAAVPECPA